MLIVLLPACDLEQLSTLEIVIVKKQNVLELGR